MSVLSVLVAQWHKSFAQEVLSRSAIDACPGPILAICLLLPLLNSAGAIDCELSVENGCAVERVAGLPMVCQWYFIGYSQNDAFHCVFIAFFRSCGVCGGGVMACPGECESIPVRNCSYANSGKLETSQAS